MNELSSNRKARYMRAWRKRNNPAAQRATQAATERRRAVERLIELHRGEFDRLVQQEADQASGKWWRGDEEPGT